MKVRVWNRNLETFLAQGKEWFLDFDFNLYFLDVNQAKMIPVYEEIFTVQKNSGKKDINGRDIFEGDFVVVYPENYSKRLIQGDTEDGINVYLVDTKRPRPLKDIVFYKGEVKFYDSEFRVNVEKNGSGVASTSLDGYWYEVIGNVFETPKLVQPV